MICICDNGAVPSSDATFATYLGGDSHSCTEFAFHPFDGHEGDWEARVAESGLGDACLYYSTIGHAFCGCAEPYDLGERLADCNFCWGSPSLPGNFDPEAGAFGFDDLGYNCGQFLAEVVSNPDVYCPAQEYGELKEHYLTAVNCGCEPPTGCETCSNGEAFMMYSNTFVDVNGEWIDCRSLMDFSVYPDVCPGGILAEEYGNDCCRPSCYLCPATSPDEGEYFRPDWFRDDEYEVEPGRTVSCHDMSEDPHLFPGDEDVCPGGKWLPELKDTCCGSCTICVDGSSPNPGATVHDPGTYWGSGDDDTFSNSYPDFPCETYIAETQYSESCDFYNVMGYLYCGCPDPGLTERFEDCPFCYGSSSLPDGFDPSKKLGSADEIRPDSTCGRLVAEVASVNRYGQRRCGQSTYEVQTQTSIAHEACGCDEPSPRYDCDSNACDIALADPMPQYEAYGTNFSCWELLFAPVNDDICPGGGEPSDDFKEKCGCNDAKGSGAAATTTIAFALRALMPALLLASVAFSFV